MQASTTKHSSSTATVSAGGEGFRSVTGPPPMAASGGVSDATTSPGSADASLMAASCAGAASLTTGALTAGAGSAEIAGGGISAGTIAGCDVSAGRMISAGSAEAIWTGGAAGSVVEVSVVAASAIV